MNRPTPNATLPPSPPPADVVSARPITPYGFGMLVGAAFGLIDILANAGVVVAAPASVVLRALGVTAFAGLLLRMRRPGPTPPGRAVARMAFGRGYWLIVAAEVAAIAIGNAALSGPLGAPHASVAWISVVVGVHFLGLAALWQARFLIGLGIAIAVCGAIGLLAAAAGSSAAVIAAVGGLCPGGLLLGTAYWGSADRGRSRRTMGGN